MQALWSRAGQAHRCGCRACETVVSTLGRRVTTAARPRKVTFADIFTACYSSMFATAAIVDAVRKEDRRQEIDRLLEETRRELAQLRNLEVSQSTTSNTSDHHDISLDQMHPLWESIKDIYTNRPYMKEIHKPATIRIDEFLNRVHTKQYECPDQATMDAYRQTDYEHLEQVIIREETDDNIIHRRPMNSIQLQRAGRTLNHLVRQLLKRADTHDQSPESPSPTFDEAVKLANQTPSYKYLVESNPEMIKQNRVKLNLGLRKVIGSTLSLKEKVGRVNGGNHGRFLRSLACIAGLDGKTGAKIRRRLPDDMEPTRIKRNNIQTWTQTGDYFWEHAPLDIPLIEAVIKGFLQLKLFDQAATFFVSCMKTKVVLSTDVIKRLFDECIVALDWRSAVRLIQGFADCAKTWPSMLLGRDQDTTYLINRVHVLLDLAGLRSSGVEVSESALKNLSISNHGFRRFLSDLAAADSTSQLEIQHSPTDLASPSGTRLLQLEALWKEQDLVAKTTRSIESKLLYPDFSQRFRELMASHIGNTAANYTLELNKEVMEAFASLPHYEPVEACLADCKTFENTSDTRPNTWNSVIEMAKRSQQTIASDRVGECVRTLLREDEPDMLLTQKTTTVKRINAAQRKPLQARPMRLTAWPVADQQVGYPERASFASFG
ncbi:hypothetical protein ACLX1H_006292 [Fusarium chlamydosporum]